MMSNFEIIKIFKAANSKRKSSSSSRNTNSPLPEGSSPLTQFVGVRFIVVTTLHKNVYSHRIDSCGYSEKRTPKLPLIDLVL